ncbi:CD83 antigen [Megalobrama amblycephala]|uniref:CD83 antigen n=1 Tax=Megalobrama amblycephala TaxID=75352 RepID=UPI002013F2A8|nr:CD83 antigen [Megalobrama amblycephala]
MKYLSEFILCLVTFAVVEGVKPDIVVITGEDAVLPCAAKSKEGVQYRSVIWYKVAEGPSRTLTGLVMKRLTENDGKVQKYKGVEREVELLESTKSLILSNVTAEDSGIYSCFLSAPLGHQNQEGKIILNVNEYHTVEQNEYNKGDYQNTIHVMAFAVLGVAFLMFCISYVCSRSIFQSNKKLSKDSLLKMPHQGKNLIVTKHLDCKTLPEVFV